MLYNYACSLILNNPMILNFRSWSIRLLSFSLKNVTWIGISRLGQLRPMRVSGT